MIKKIIIILIFFSINTANAENIVLKDYGSFIPHYSDNINGKIRFFSTSYKRGYVYDERGDVVHYIQGANSGQLAIYIKLLNGDIISIPNYTTGPSNNGENHISDIYYYNYSEDSFHLYTFYGSGNGGYRCTSRTHIGIANNKLIIGHRSLMGNNSNCSVGITHPLRYIDLNNPNLGVLNYEGNIPYSQLKQFQSGLLFQTTNNQYTYIESNSLFSNSCNETLGVCLSQGGGENNYQINGYKVISNGNDKSIISMDYTNNDTNIRSYFSQINQSGESIILENKFINNYNFSNGNYSFIDEGLINSIGNFPNGNYSPLIQKNELATYYTLGKLQYLNSENIFGDGNIGGGAPPGGGTNQGGFTEQFININGTYCELFNSTINPRISCDGNLIRNGSSIECIEGNKIEYNSTNENAFIYYSDESKIGNIEFSFCGFTNIVESEVPDNGGNDNQDNSGIINTLKNLFGSSNNDIENLKNSINGALDMGGNGFNIGTGGNSSITFNPGNNDYGELIGVNQEKKTCDMFNSDGSFAYYSNGSYDLTIDLTNILSLGFDDKIPFIDELLFIPNKILGFITNPLQNIFSTLRVFGGIGEKTYCYFGTLQTIEFQKHIKMGTSFWGGEQVYIPGKLTIIDYLILFFVGLPLLIITVRILLY